MSKPKLDDKQMKNKTLFKRLLACFLLINTSLLVANEVEIIDVKATQSSDKTWSFRVTLKHDDKGWDHYANEWQVIAPDNKILATRTLYHPHVNEQPFTRGTQGVKIPEGVKSVRIIAKDTVHGLSNQAVKIDLATNKKQSILLKE